MSKLDGFYIHNKYKELGGLGLLINPTQRQLDIESKVNIKLKQYIMRNSIKELRVRIDGISQLVKELKPAKFVVDLALIPKNMTAEQVAYMVNESPVIFLNDTNESPIIQTIEAHEISKAFDSLIFGKGWLGIMLGEMGEANPYKSGYKTKDDIEPTADVSLPITLVKQLNTTKPIGASVEEMNHIEKVDFIRTDLEKLIKELKVIPQAPYKPTDFTREFAIARTNSYNHLVEAKMWLGLELQRIKNEN